ncbi:hypothetical protein VPH35_072785 [Triticum aestivum]
MGFEVDFLGERVGRVMVGFMRKMKKLKVIHGPRSRATTGLFPCRSAAMPGRRTGPCRTPRTSESRADKHRVTSGDNYARADRFRRGGVRDTNRRIVAVMTQQDGSVGVGQGMSAIGSGKLLMYTVRHQF